MQVLQETPLREPANNSERNGRGIDGAESAMEVLVKPLNLIVRVEPGANLLQALQSARVPISYSCMAGRCGTCRCKVTDGAATDRQQEQGTSLNDTNEYVLACRTLITRSCTVEVPEPDEVVVHPARIVRCTVVTVEDLTHDIRRVQLRPAKPMEFSPGQYVQVQFTPEHVRPYSMAGLCSDSEFEFHIRHVLGGRVTGYIAGNLKAGDTVRISGPLGTAYLRSKHEGPILCVAGGTGLAPILSILRGAAAAGMRNPIHLYFGVRSPRDVYGVEQLTQMEAALPSLKVHIVVAAGITSGKQRGGLVTEAIEEDLRDLSGWRAYLCGSPSMVEAAALLVRRKGIPGEHVYADAFYSQCS